MNRQQTPWIAAALVAAFVVATVGCSPYRWCGGGHCPGACGPLSGRLGESCGCGDMACDGGCGGSCGAEVPTCGGCGHCDACGHRVGALLHNRLTCGHGCGDVYWGEWFWDTPSRCDGCDCYGNWLGWFRPPFFLGGTCSCGQGLCDGASLAGCDGGCGAAGCGEVGCGHQAGTCPDCGGGYDFARPLASPEIFDRPAPLPEQPGQEAPRTFQENLPSGPLPPPPAGMSRARGTRSVLRAAHYQPAPVGTSKRRAQVVDGPVLIDPR